MDKSKEVVIKSLKNKTIKLSFSSMKHFGLSPKQFIRYKTQPKKPQTESMVKGSLCDVLLTNPNNFNNEFVVVENFPTSDNQKAFALDMINGMDMEEAFKVNYKRGNADDVYSSLSDYIEAIKSGKNVTNTQMLGEAKEIVSNLKRSEIVMQLLDSCDKFQQKLEWNVEGWNFIGFSDAETDGLMIDLKFSKDSNPDKFERDIQYNDYFMQLGMYADSKIINGEPFPECYNIVYDSSMNFSVIKLDNSYIHYGIRKYRYLLKKLEQCLIEDRFDESYNFFDHNKEVRIAYKPKWVKGFE